MAKKIPLLYLVFFFSFFLLLFHFFATKLHIYWIISWSDIISHLLGGIVLSLIFWFFALRSKKDIFIKNPRFFTLLFAIFIGVIWELFQVFFNISLPGSSNYLSSTAYDLFFDIFGAFVGYYYLINSQNDRK